MSLRASVSNLDLYRVWEASEDLNLGWIKDRILGKVEQTPAMKAGEAFHKAIELADGDAEVISAMGHTFTFECDIDIFLPTIREVSISKEYGGLTVRGRVDAVSGHMVADHKTTEQFDADRLLEGYQWRYYLDMLNARQFVWNVFVIREREPLEYAVVDFHHLEQRRYPELHNDCLRLAARYEQFAKEYLQ